MRSIRDLSLFVETARSGSFSGAGRRLGLSRSAVAKGVARLESELQVALFVRTTRSLGLTEEGSLLLETSERLEAELAELSASLGRRSASVVGRVRGSVPVSFGTQWLGPIFSKLLGEHPGLQLDLSFEDRYVDLPREGLDFCVRVGAPPDQLEMSAWPLAVHEVLTCASPGFLRLYGHPERPSELSELPCVEFSGVGRRRTWTVRAGDGRLERVTVRPRHAFGHGPTLNEAIRAGHGIGQVPTWSVGDDLRTGVLVPLFHSSPVEVAPIVLLSSTTRRRNPALRTVIEAMQAAFRERPWPGAD